MKHVLAIAGSDCCGAGGIQADIKTITAHKIYASSVITSMTAQNTTGVYDILESTPKFLGRQLDCVLGDMMPDAVKVGMVSNENLVRVIADKFIQYQVSDIVLDTCMISSSGRKLVSMQTERILLSKLVPLATVILPNLAEAEYLSGVRIDSIENLDAAAGIISEKYRIKNIFFKEAHKIIQKGDMLFENGRISWIEGVYEGSEDTFGKGCALSSAIACHLAEGENLYQSIVKAKQYVQKAVKNRVKFGKGKNPLNHMM